MSVKTSKFLSLILRHAPEKIGVELDENGWVNVDELLKKAAIAGTVISPEGLREIVANNDKKRFTLSEDGQRIRTAQGHSVKIDIAKPPSIPPAILYHGTATRFLDSILATGLTPQKRNHVHLSADTETASQVGQRHGKIAILQIDAARLYGDGQKFWQADNGVWLSEPISPDYFKVM